MFEFAMILGSNLGDEAEKGKGDTITIGLGKRNHRRIEMGELERSIETQQQYLTKNQTWADMITQTVITTKRRADLVITQFLAYTTNILVIQNLLPHLLSVNVGHRHLFAIVHLNHFRPT